MVVKLLGDGKVELSCCDGITRIGVIRGNMKGRRKVWIRKNDIVLISLRDFEKRKADIIHKFTPDEVCLLRKEHEIPESIFNPYALEQQQEKNRSKRLTPGGLGGLDPDADAADDDPITFEEVDDMIDFI